MTTTTFTINRDFADAAVTFITSQGCEVITREELAAKPDGMTVDVDWYGERLAMPLPAATRFTVTGHFSRTQLTKAFGRTAMVRGVRHS